MCEEIQELFWLVMFRVARSGPKVMLTAETVSLKMKQRILQEKLLSARRILLQEDSLARRMYEEQRWDGLVYQQMLGRYAKVLGWRISTKWWSAKRRSRRPSSIIITRR